MEPTQLHKIAFVCFSGAGALVLLVLLAGFVPALYCRVNPSPGCESGMPTVMAALGLCALGLAIIVGLAGIIVSGLAISRQRDASLMFLSALSVLFDLVIFLPRALPSLQASNWVLFALVVYPPIVFAVSVWWFLQQRASAMVEEPQKESTDQR